MPGDRFRVVGDADDEGWLRVESLADTTATGQVPASYMAEVAPEPAVKLDKKALKANNAAKTIDQLAASVPSYGVDVHRAVSRAINGPLHWARLGAPLF